MDLSDARSLKTEQNVIAEFGATATKNFPVLWCFNQTMLLLASVGTLGFQ